MGSKNAMYYQVVYIGPDTSLERLEVYRHTFYSIKKVVRKTGLMAFMADAGDHFQGMITREGEVKFLDEAGKKKLEKEASECNMNSFSLYLASFRRMIENHKAKEAALNAEKNVGVPADSKPAEAAVRSEDVARSEPAIPSEG